MARNTHDFRRNKRLLAYRKKKALGVYQELEQNCSQARGTAQKAHAANCSSHRTPLGSGLS